MAMMEGTRAINSQPPSSDRPRAVVLYSNAWGHEGGNDIQAEFLDPGVANSLLSVSVTGNRITVNLATDSSGALSSFASAVVNAINNDAAASALVTAYVYGGTTGNGLVRARALVNLSDFLNAPPSVQRGPFQAQAIRIGAHRDGSKIGVFIYCQQHAREWVTPLVCLETAERLLRNYAIDPTTKDFVDNLDIFIVPSSNPDGSHYSFYDFAMQRKNMTNYCSVTATSGMPSSRNSWGVDLNRNNSVGTLFDGYDGASTSCTSEVYAGPSEVSEPEIKNEQWIVDTYGNIKFAMNVHTYGGYYMWSPGAYILSGRVTLPAPNIGIEAYFFEGADLVLNRIREERGTVILPERTGPIADVLYSAAGNSADDQWYRKDIIAYSFEAGADRFVSTTSGTQQQAVGFQPNFANEGQYEALEFASGNYGLLETALQYAFDNEPPVAAMTPDGAASQTPVRTTFTYVNEPAVIYYTTDGSTPTLASQTWEAQGPRRPGQVFLVDETTTFKWIAKDIKGNVSQVFSARFAIDTDAPTTAASLSPDPLAGGVYADPTTVTLLADDNYDGGGAGVDFTTYRLDGGAWTTYSGPFQVAGGGPHVLEYYSVDLAGNTEATRSQAFLIVLDNFNRANANKVGGSWSGPGANGGYKVASQQLDVQAGDALYWSPTSFGADQEASFTFVKVDPRGQHQSLLLKVQGSTYSSGVIAVYYNALTRKIGVETYIPGKGWKTLIQFSYTLANGDRLRGRALVDGSVLVYVNANLIGTTNAGSFFAGKGGKVGLWFFVAADAVLDDFGGNTLLTP
jgi:hypothetical protein